MITVSCIGAGRVGKTLLKLWQQAGLVHVGGILNRNRTNAESAVAFIGAGRACTSVQELVPADLVLITTNDQKIAAFAEQLEPHCAPGTVIVHCSGALSSNVLVRLQQRGCSIGSAHPVKSFADPASSAATFPGTLCAVEGDSYAVSLVSSLLEAVGARVFPLSPEHKTQYHAALVLANNYLTTLHYQATQLLQGAGVGDAVAHELATMLMHDALRNLSTAPHAAALTGPLQRGDLATVQEHLRVLAPPVRDIYIALARGTLPLLSPE